MLKIAVAESPDFSPEAEAVLRRFGTIDFFPLAGQADLPRMLQDFDVLWLRLGLRVGTLEIPKECRCAHIVCPATGTDHLDSRACEASGIQIHSLRGDIQFLRTIRATVEYTLGLSLALLRRIVPAAASVASGEWDRLPYKGTELYGKAVGLVGVGRVGTEVAKLFTAFGSKVAGVDPLGVDAEVCRPVDTLEALCETSDIVSIHANLTPETAGLVSRAMVDRMRPTGIVVNTARGPLLDDDAVADALLDRRLAGVAVDVLPGEPRVSSRLLDLSRVDHRVLVTPHIAGNTVESLARVELRMAHRLQMALRAK